jgi:hypothetical protein
LKAAFAEGERLAPLRGSLRAATTSPAMNVTRANPFTKIA